MRRTILLGLFKDSESTGWARFCCNSISDIVIHQRRITFIDANICFVQYDFFGIMYSGIFDLFIYNRLISIFLF